MTADVMVADSTADVQSKEISKSVAIKDLCRVISF